MQYRVIAEVHAHERVRQIAVRHVTNWRPLVAANRLSERASYSRYRNICTWRLLRCSRVLKGRWCAARIQAVPRKKGGNVCLRVRLRADEY
jgi:hypothetical protein